MTIALKPKMIFQGLGDGRSRGYILEHCEKCRKARPVAIRDLETIGEQINTSSQHYRRCLKNELPLLLPLQIENILQIRKTALSRISALPRLVTLSDAEEEHRLIR
jgi:hypothetical protein